MDFFKDHPIEWERVNITDSGFKMKSDVLVYLKDNISDFDSRRNLLIKYRVRKHEDPYRLLSAHIHAQNKRVAPSSQSFVEIIGTIEKIKNCASIAFDVSEYVHDIFFLSDFWPYDGLPNEIQNDLSRRISQSGDREKFFR